MSTALLNPQSTIFNPQSGDVVAEINALHHAATGLAAQARALGESATNKAIMAGLKLAALKAATPHGQWEAKFSSGARRVGKSNAQHGAHLLEFSEATARNYIAVAANLMAQRLSSEQSAALMQLASRADSDDLQPAEAAFLAEVTPEKSLRQLYLNLGIIQPTRREAYAMGAAEDAACRIPDDPKPKRPPSMAESLKMKKDDARVHWFGTAAAGMVNPKSILQALMHEARNAAESQLNYLHKADLAEIETTLKELLKLTKHLLAESTKS